MRKELNFEGKTYSVEKPGRTEIKEAKRAANKAFKDAVEGGDCFLRSELDLVLEKKGVWNKALQEKYDQINNEVRDGLKKLKAGGIDINEAKKIALDVRTKRYEALALISERNKFDSYTAEAESENAYFDCLVALCSKDEYGKRIFSSLSDYSERATEPLSIFLATELSKLLYDLKDDSDKDLPENKFLMKYKFVDEKLRLVNEQGKLIDLDGKLINEEGRYVNEEGQLVNVYGDRVDEDGNLLEAKPFLKDGQPLV